MMSTFLFILAWLSIANSCGASFVGIVRALAGREDACDRALMRCAAWAIAAALFFMAAK